MIKIITVDEIIHINEEITGSQILSSYRKGLIESCFSSYTYYETPQHQISSIIKSLVKNHCFVDGNKRTALLAYNILCRLNNIQYVKNNHRMVNILCDIASSNKSVEECSDMLFPEENSSSKF